MSSTQSAPKSKLVIIGVALVAMSWCAPVKAWNPLAGTACAYGFKQSGCDTPYAQATTAFRVDESTIRVTARGNRFTTSETIYRYAMRRAAQETLAAGFDLFLIVEQADASRHVVGSTGGSPVAGFNAQGQAALVPGQSSVYSYDRPGQAMTVKMLKGPKSADSPSAVYDAHEVLKFVG